jgi:DNA-binding NtrC family response regulator
MRSLRRESTETEADETGRPRDPGELADFATLFAGEARSTTELLKQIVSIAQSDRPLCIQAEYGSGRAVVARAVHDRSMRQRQPFMSVNAAAFPEQYLEEHLFAGANPLTGRADCTLFIDSVSDLGPIAQARLLRLIEAGVLNVDGMEIPLHVRVIAADDGRKLKGAVTSGRFRTELFYQLREHQLELPALRDRAADLPTIVARMLARLSTATRPVEISPDALAALEHYWYPGNFRELAHAIVHAATLASGATIELGHLPLDIQHSHHARATATIVDVDKIESLDAVAKRFEREYLLRVLRAVGGNRTRAAKMLDLSRKGLWQKLKAHGIDANEGRADESD